MSAEATQIKGPAAWLMYRALVGIGLVCAFIIVSIFLYTKPFIAANQKAALEQAIFSVLEKARVKKTFAWWPEEGFKPVSATDAQGPDAQQLLYAGYDNQGALVGFALEANGMGYQDNIQVMYGVDANNALIIGFAVISSRETPGLGSKIMDDPAFLNNFRQLDVSLNVDGDGLAHPIEAVKSGRKQQPWQIDSITGATVSSKAVAKLLNNSTELWLPRLSRPGVLEIFSSSPAISPDKQGDSQGQVN